MPTHKKVTKKVKGWALVWPARQLVMEVEGENARIFEEKLAALKADVGEEIFNKLSARQKKFLAEVTGTISLSGVRMQEYLTYFLQKSFTSNVKSPTH